MTDTYTMKIPRDLADLFQEYIDNNRKLGYRTISQYILHILQDHAKELLNLKKESQFRKDNTIKLKSGTYSKEELQKLLKDMED